MVARCHEDDGEVVLDRLERWTSFAPLETLLSSGAAAVVGLDAPLGLPREFVDQTGWPPAWEDYVAAAGRLPRARWRELLARFRADRPAGQKHLLRDADVLAGAQSPLNAVRPPVALMFHEVAPRVLAAGVAVAGIRDGRSPTVAEVYPALAVRLLHGPGRPPPYKGAGGGVRAAAAREQRERLVRRLRRDAFPYALRLRCDERHARQLVDDPGGDHLDAVLCAVQVAWAARRADLGVPSRADPVEGWVVDPALVPRDQDDRRA